jgi:hypothetical protein
MMRTSGVPPHERFVCRPNACLRDPTSRIEHQVTNLLNDHRRVIVTEGQVDIAIQAVYRDGSVHGPGSPV